MEIAVLECARGGILRSGLAFDRCDVGVVLNVSADHLGQGDIDTIEQMAKVKAVVAEAVSGDGYAVLNADDPLVSQMAKNVKGKVAYFSMNPDNPIIQEHLRRNGIAAVYENGYVSICEGQWTLRIERVENIPLTLKGMAPFMIANVLASCLAAFVKGVDIELIRRGVRTFRPSAEQTPGRMNLFDLKHCSVLIDYAHNPAGYEAVGDFVKNWKGDRVGVIGGPGDRRDEDLRQLGVISARLFDYIIVKEDDDTRGRERGEVADIIVDGILSENPHQDYIVVLDEAEAIETGISKVKDGGLVVVFPESVSRAIKIVKKYQAAD